MSWRPDIVQVGAANNIGDSENGAPRSAFIVREIDRFRGLLDSGYLVKTIQIDANHVPWAAELPRVDDVTHHLPFVGITRTGVNFDPSILVADGSGAAQVWDIDLPPIRLVAARNEPGAVVGVQDHGQTQLPEIAVAIGLLPLLFGFGQRGQEHSREDGNDRDDDQQLDQGES